jgi:hypothetical protein
MDWKRKMVILAVPAALAVGGGSLIAAQAASPQPTPSGSSQTNTAGESATEAPDKPEAAETPGTPDAAHADANDQADHQFDGSE